MAFFLAIFLLFGFYYLGFRDGNSYAMIHSCKNTTMESKSTVGPSSRVKRASIDEDLCACWYQYAFTITLILYLLSISGMGMCLQMAMTRPR